MIDELVARSRRLGSDPDLVVHGGGNTSSKAPEQGRAAMRIKGSGTDLATIDASGFPGLWLDPLRELRARPAMSDEEMVALLAEQAIDPGQRPPSIETLLHAFLDAPHVDHTHADAICALTNHPDGRAAVAEVLGEDVAFVPYERPGFSLSKAVAEAGDASAVVLEHHGLVTWGETHEASVQRTLELDAAARAHLAARTKPHRSLPARDSEPFVTALRDALGPVALVVDDRQRPLADREDVDELRRWRGTPDHMLRIGPRSAVLEDAGTVADVLDAYAAEYVAYYERHEERVPDGYGMLSASPRVFLVPGVGTIATGADERAARVNADLSLHSHRVTALALDAFGAIRWLDEREVFDFEYWPMELRKLKL
jgi:rhamnose utilization protein RhaD (predicted bifunctional aldolase and dehydrogenase)